MQRGDLASNPLTGLLSDLAAEQQTGCLSIDGPDREMRLYLDAGLLDAVLPAADGTPADELSPVLLDDAVLAVAEAAHWTTGAWRFRRRQRADRRLARPVAVAELLDLVAQQEHQEHQEQPEQLAADLGAADLGAPATLTRAPADDAELARALADASQTLSEVLGTSAGDDDEPGMAVRVIRHEPLRPVDSDPEEQARLDRLRAGAAAELAEAHAEAEAERRHAGQAEAERRHADSAEVVDLSARREAAQAAREAQQAERAAEIEQREQAAIAELLSEDEPADAWQVDAPPAEETVQPAQPAQEPDSHQSATALLREMALDSGADDRPSPEPPKPAAPDAPAPTAGSSPAAPTIDRRMTDTAALLRELSSLGDEEPGVRSPAPSQRPAPPRNPSAAPKNRRKGLFGRG